LDNWHACSAIHQRTAQLPYRHQRHGPHLAVRWLRCQWRAGSLDGNLLPGGGYSYSDAYGNGYSHGNADGYSDSYSDSNGNTDGDTWREAESYSAAAPDTGASADSLAVFGTLRRELAR
jgi:hypothetical protein